MLNRLRGSSDCSKADVRGNDSVYRVTCMLKEEPSALFPLLIPLNFKWTLDESIIWANEDIEFKISPFLRRGREIMGYRIHFKGNPEQFEYLMDRFLSRFNPRISGIEWIHESNSSQAELIRIADRNNFKRDCMHGIFEHNEVGVILMPTGDIHLQVRNQNMNTSNIIKHMRVIQETAAHFQTESYDLFSFVEEGAIA